MNLLSNFDRHLISEIDLMGDQSIAMLARNLSVSRTKIELSLKRYLEAGIITGYTSIFDLGSVGISCVAVYVKLGKQTDVARDKLIEKIKKLPEVYWMARLWGQYDLLFAIQANNMQDFSVHLGNIQLKFSNIIETDVAIRTRVFHFQRTYLWKGKQNRRLIEFSSGKSVQKISKRERDLCLELANDPRKTIIDLAKSTKSSRPHVYSNLRQLKEGGLFRGVGSLFDATKLGIGVYHLLIRLRRTDPKSRNELLEFCYGQDNITFCIETIGQWQVELCCEVESHSKLQQIIASLRGLLLDNLIDLSIAPFENYYLKYKFDMGMVEVA